MVKGNWERRVERAAESKKAKKDAKALKAAGLKPLDPLDALNALLQIDGDPEVWLTPRDGAAGATLCRPHFRSEACANRRCRYSHAATISAYGPPADPSGGAATEPPIERLPRVDALLFPARPPPQEAPAAAAGALDALADGPLALVLSLAPRLPTSVCSALRGAALASPAVAAAKAAARPALLAARRRFLLRNARRVRYAIAGDQPPRLAFDAGDDGVWRSFTAPLRAPRRAARAGPRPRAASTVSALSALLAEEEGATGGRNRPRSLAALFAACPDGAAAALASASRKKAVKKKRQGKVRGKKDEFARGQ